MPGIGPMEIIVVLIVGLLVVGPKKLPDVGRSLGNGMRQFRDSMSGNGPDEIESHAEEAPAVAPARD